MEKSTPIGLLLGVFFIFGTIFMGEGAMMFFDPGSLTLVIGGTIAALMVTFPLKTVLQIPAIVKNFFGHSKPDLSQYIERFVDLSRLARREGLLALDRSLADITDPFMKFGLEMAVDGIEEAEISDMMRLRIGEESKKRMMGNTIFNSAGTYCPAFGMVGTLIGLIQMLQNLSSPDQIGAGMAIALITTFWGALLANLVFLPFAAKMKEQGLESMKEAQIISAGVMAIVRGESPSMIEKKLGVFLEEGEKAEIEEASENQAVAA